MDIRKLGMASICTSAALACGQGGETKADVGDKPGTFGYDAAFLREKHPDAVILRDPLGMAGIVVLPAYQGRVMTSTAEGDAGSSFGWINHELIASGTFTPHMSAFGGEERFWLGPEGGQFSIYFRPGTEFGFEDWQVPGVIDTIPFRLTGSDERSARFEKDMELLNRTGTSFRLKAERSVTLMDRDSILRFLGSDDKDLRVVGFETDNRITNTGDRRWEKSTGLLSIWILSMLNAGPTTTIAIPWKGGDAGSGRSLTDDYFGKVPLDRLRVTDRLILMRADGEHRSKIGIPPERALPLAASYDSAGGVLTIAHFSLPEGEQDYVNSLWKIQEEPYAGDAVNAYNDGPIDGKQMGRFYELESSSPAAALEPGATIRHWHRTVHVKGERPALDAIARRLLGAGLEDIRP